MESKLVLNENITTGIIRLFYKPKSAYEIIIEKWEVNHKYILLGLFGFLNSIGTIEFNDPSIGLILTKVLFKGLIGISIGWLSIWLLSHLINLTNKLFGGEAEFEEVFVVFSFALIPLIIGLLINLITKVFFNSNLLLFPSIVLVSCFIWTFVLVLIGNKLISKLNLVKNLISVLISFGIIILMISLLLKK